MITPKLTPDQRAQAEDLFARLKADLLALAQGDDDTLFNFRRYVYKELMYDERSTPMERRRLKKVMWKKQEGKCAICEKELLLEGSELDRTYAPKGYVEENVKLVHHDCHYADQKVKGFK